MTTPDRIKRAMQNAKNLQDEAVDLKKVLTDYKTELVDARNASAPTKDPS